MKKRLRAYFEYKLWKKHKIINFKIQDFLKKKFNYYVFIKQFAWFRLHKNTLKQKFDEH